MICTQVHLTAFLVWVTVVSRGMCSCPPGCICVGEQVKCPPNTITSIPPSVSNSTSVMTLSQNRFTNPNLGPANFTGFHNLDELFLQDCGIRHVDSGTFSGMTQLNLLDLSLNDLQTIAPRAFSSLRLEYLFLSDNPSLQLSPSVLTDLQTEVLDLASCGLRDIDPTLFTPMIGTLRKLTLQGNKLKRFSPAMLGVFASLEKLRFDDNPLACDCHMLWLKEFYDRNKDDIRDADNGNEEEPKCASPTALQGEYFSSLLTQDFLCERPTINTSVHINATMSKMRCEAFGYPPASITWYLPNGNNRVYPAHRSSERTLGELQLLASDTTHQGLYKCVASNDAGNVSFSLNLKLPTPVSTPDALCETPLVTTTGQEVIIPAKQPVDLDDEKTGSHTLLKTKYFSLLDLLSAILGTFVGTLLLSVIILHFCVYKRKKTSTASHYSDSSSPMSDYAAVCMKNGGAHPSSTNPAHPMMLRTGAAPQCIQNRPLPNKPYARVYDDTHYMSSPLNDRDDIENNVISPYGHLNAAGTVVSPVNSQAMFPCGACQSQCDTRAANTCMPNN